MIIITTIIVMFIIIYCILLLYIIITIVIIYYHYYCYYYSLLLWLLIIMRFHVISCYILYRLCKQKTFSNKILLNISDLFCILLEADNPLTLLRNLAHHSGNLTIEMHVGVEVDDPHLLPWLPTGRHGRSLPSIFLHQRLRWRSCMTGSRLRRRWAWSIRILLNGSWMGSSNHCATSAGLNCRFGIVGLWYLHLKCTCILRFLSCFILKVTCPFGCYLVWTCKISKHQPQNTGVRPPGRQWTQSPCPGSWKARPCSGRKATKSTACSTAEVAEQPNTAGYEASISAKECLYRTFSFKLVLIAALHASILNEYSISRHPTLPATGATGRGQKALRYLEPTSCHQFKTHVTVLYAAVTSSRHQK